MGFRPTATTVVVTWPQDHRLHGLEVKARSVSVDEYHEIMRLMFGSQQPEPSDNVMERARQIAQSQTEQVDRDAELMNKFASYLVSWNYEDPETGEPLPADRAGIGKADPSYMGEIIGGWVNALVSVPNPLQRPSGNGRTPADSEESALRLGSLSQSLPN